MDVLKNGSGKFVHAQTFQGMAIQAAAALKVLEIIEKENLLANVVLRGDSLKAKLIAALGKHPNIGDIRGSGLFIGIEIVANRYTKEPFDPKLNIAQKLVDMAV